MTDAITDRDAIERLMNAYCFTIDAGDLAAFSDLFSNGYWGVVGDPNGFAHGSEALARVMESIILYDGKPRTRHLMTNVDIRVESGAKTATAESYVMVMQAVPPDFPLQAIFVGRYSDRFQCDDGQWSFAAREIHAELFGDLSWHRSDMA